MSIDWFMLLAPFAAIPLILIFGFTGCVLPRHGTLPSNPEFIFPGGLSNDVTHLSVTITVVGWNDTRTETQSLDASQFPFSFNPITLTVATIDVADVNTDSGSTGFIGPFLTLTCDCSLTFAGKSAAAVPTAEHDGDDDEDVNKDFTLSGSGTTIGNYSVS
jgi:hypothetical protein